MKKILVLPAWMTELRFYKPNNDLEKRFGNFNDQVDAGDVVIGMSLGALIVLRTSSRIKGRIVLVNPPFPRRSLLGWLIKWIGFMFAEGLLLNRQAFTKNPIKFIHALVQCIGLLSFKYEEIIEKLPKDRVVIIRGAHDDFFCDERAEIFFSKNGFKVVAVESGHNWSPLLEQAILDVCSVP